MTESQKQDEQRKQVEEEKLFQETSHIKDLIANSGFEPNYDLQKTSEFPLSEIITSFGMFVISFITCHVIIRHYGKFREIHIPSITFESKNYYLTEVESLLSYLLITFNINAASDTSWVIGPA